MQISSLNGDQLGTSYQLTTVHKTHDNKTVEMKRIITAREYNSAYRTRDETRHVITQKRISFIWKMQSFTIHIFREPVKELFICYAQTADDGANDESAAFEIPPFLNVERRLEENSDDREKFGTFDISLIKN